MVDSDGKQLAGWVIGTCSSSCSEGEWLTYGVGQGSWKDPVELRCEKGPSGTPPSNFKEKCLTTGKKKTHCEERSRNNHEAPKQGKVVYMGLRANVVSRGGCRPDWHGSGGTYNFATGIWNVGDRAGGGTPGECKDGWRVQCGNAWAGLGGKGIPRNEQGC